MPLPAPNPNETQDTYVSRCISSEGAVQDFPDDDQRLAVCSSLYESAQKSGNELTAPIVHKDLDRHIVYGPVLIPDMPDSDGDVVSADKIEKVAHRFMEEYRLMEHMHTLESIARPVESYIAPVDLVLGDAHIPKGSWVAGARVTNETAWKDVKSGKLTGFSIVAVPTGAGTATKRLETVEKKLTLRQIEESGRDWEVIAIGLVDMPAIPLAKWTAVKRLAEPTILDKFRSLLTPKVSQDLLVESSGKEVTHERSDEVDEKELAAAIGSAVSEGLKPITDRLDTIDAASAEVQKKADEKEKEEEKGKEKKVEVTADDLEKAVAGAASKAATEAVTEVLVKFDEAIEGLPKTTAKSLAESIRGQDGTSEKKNEPDRDAFGRKIRSNA